MNYTPLNINNKSIQKSNWFIKQKVQFSIVLNSKIDDAYLKPFVSDHFEIEKFEGSPIISIVINVNESLSLKYLPFIKNKKSMHVQLRTYVKRAGVPGILLLSLDTNHQSLNSILRPLTDLPVIDSNIKMTSKDNNSSMQVDLARDGFQFYTNIHPLSERVFTNENPMLDWINNRFHIYNIQKGQVVEWRIDHSLAKTYKAKLKNIQFNHSLINNQVIKFQDSCFYMDSNITRIWPPSLSNY